MGTGQMMFSIAAILLLSLVALMANDNFLSTGDTLDQNKRTIMAVSLATSMMDQITARNYVFDDSLQSARTQVGWGPVSGTVSQFSPSPMGPSAGESSPVTFDDVGDFNGYTRSDTTDIGVFTTSCEVVYVDPDHPDIVRSVPSDAKRLTVTVAPVLPGAATAADSVRLSTVVVYNHL